MKLIFVSVGTSAITNTAMDALQQRLDEYDQQRYKDPTENTVQGIVQSLANHYQNNPHSMLPAEIASLKRIGITQGDIVVLLVSDTGGGRICAAYLEQKVYELFRGRGLQNIMVCPIEGLRVDSKEKFIDGVRELLKTIQEKILAYPNAELVFNITGGYKAVIPFLTIMAMEKKARIHYLFEDSNELLDIPALPISIETTNLMNTAEKITLWRRLDLQLVVSEDRFNAVLSDYRVFVYVNEGCVALSDYGDLIVPSLLKDLGRQRLLPSPSDRIRYGNNFETSLRNFDDRLPEINNRIGQLAQYLELPNHPNPRSLDFKQLRGDPVPGSTHEFDAWADQDARRIYCHFENENGKQIVVLDKLDRALH